MTKTQLYELSSADKYLKSSKDHVTARGKKFIALFHCFMQ